MSKKYIVLGLAAIVTVAFFAVPQAHAAATNLIQNPTFASSTGSSPTGWNTGAWGDASTAVFTYPVTGEDDAYAAQVSIATYGTAPGGGAAEWYFNNVPITGGTLYDFSDWYKATATNYVLAAFTLNDGTVSYQPIATVGNTNGAWVHLPDAFFTAPSNAVSMTVYHLLQNAGTLSVDNYSLTASGPQASDEFNQAMVTLSFDDGWANQVDNAAPILSAANMKATYYIISNPMLEATMGATYDLFQDPNEQYDTITTPTSVTWTPIYTDPTEASYRFSDTYTADGTSVITAQYTVNGQAQSTIIGTVPAGTNAQANFPFTLPLNPDGTTITPVSFVHSLQNGTTLTASNPSLTEYQDYMTEAQVLALQTAGNEIGDHTMDHCDLVQLYNDPNSAMTTACAQPLSASSTAAEQINGARSVLLSIGATPVDTLAYPYGTYTTDVESLLTADGIKGGRSIDIGYNTKSSNPLALKSISITENTTFDSIKPTIDTAIANKLWLVLLFHQVEDAATITKNGDVDATTPAVLQQIVSYLQSQNAMVTTLHTGMSYLGSGGGSTTSTLNVTLNVNNAAGGTKKSSDFTVVMTAGHPNPASFKGNASGTAVTIDGNVAYAANPTTITNYTASSSSGCMGSLAIGATGTCTITETYVQPRATENVIVTVNNKAGGSAKASNFTVTVTGGHPAPATFPGNASGTAVGIDALTAYSTAVSSVANYVATLSSGCARNSLSANQVVTCTITETYTLTNSLIITPAAIPNGTVGTKYSQTITVNATSGTTVWSVSSGSLPPGLSLNKTVTGATTTISGTPSSGDAFNTYTFTVKAVNGPNYGTATYVVYIAPKS